MVSPSSSCARTVWQTDCDLFCVFDTVLGDINGGSLFRCWRGGFPVIYRKLIWTALLSALFTSDRAVSVALSHGNS
jgi:hypothetical protein